MHDIMYEEQYGLMQKCASTVDSPTDLSRLDRNKEVISFTVSR